MNAMSNAVNAAQLSGGEFLLRSVPPDNIFTPEDLTAEHQAIARTAEDFWKREIAPRLEAIQHQEAGVAVSLLRKSAELGLTSVTIPEQYGGMELDLVSAMIVAEQFGRDGSYSAWHGAQTGIGTLPLLLFGTGEQKSRYLPKLATCEMVAAYCLSEPQAGSDALAARTTAHLSPDGRHYSLNGQKMWITNGGAADLYTVFANVDGKLTAFLVERGFEGVRQGAEEKKMGIKGSSTCAIYLDNVQVPAANLLGEAGRGHLIAFNILNLGRLKLGAYALGGAKSVLAQSIQYAKERIAFGKPIADFGLIQHKIAEMATYIYAAETMTYRVEGMIGNAAGRESEKGSPSSSGLLKAAEEYAIECSLVKVFASEMLDYVVDEGVQIHGGYGYHQDYLVERAYRDSRINRIFEGTNEINRLLAAGMLLKRAQKKQLALVQAVRDVQSQLANPRNVEQASGIGSSQTIERLKKAVLLLLGLAYQKFGDALEHEQEVLAGITDAMIATLALESSSLRAERRTRSGSGDLAALYTQLLLQRALRDVDRCAAEIVPACLESAQVQPVLASMRKLLHLEPIDLISLRRRIARRVLDAGRFAA